MNQFHSCSLLLLTALHTFSVVADSDVQQVPAVLVSAARTEQSTLTTPASISVITRADIDASGARHLVDVLRGRGGVQISDNYGEGSRAAVVGLRGFGETANANTLVLVDGRRLNNPDIAVPDLNSIALDDVDRIEIVQGSAGVLFGDQAVGGVINIITRRPGAMRHSLKLSAGSYDAAQLYAMTSQALDNGFDYRLSLEARKSDNYRDHNEASYLNALSKLGYDYGTGSVFGELQYVRDDLNTPGTLFDDQVAVDRRQVSPNFALDFSNLETSTAVLGLNQSLSPDWSLEAELTGRSTNGVFRLSSVFGAETQDSIQDRKVYEFTPRLIGSLPGWNGTLLTLGADVIVSDYTLSSRFGDQMNDQTQQSLYAQAVTPVSNSLNLTLGLRYASVENDLSDTGTFAIYPNGQTADDDVTVGELGLTWQADNNWRLLLRADQNYRFAKVDEYMSPAFGPTFEPVILQTQKGLSLESGLEWTAGRNAAKLLVYQLDLDNEIAFDPVNFANINLDTTRRRGVITEFNWQATARLGVIASYTYTDAQVVGGEFQGKEIPLVAKNSGMLGGNYVYSDNWQFYAELQVTGERVFSGDFDNVLDPLPGYGVVNVKAEYTQNDFSFAARVNNLFDNRYSDVGQLGFDPNTFASRAAYFPSPEINLMLTAAWQFR
jgi:iron complex outermembrane receptor protein